MKEVILIYIRKILWDADVLIKFSLVRILCLQFRLIHKVNITKGLLLLELYELSQLLYERPIPLYVLQNNLQQLIPFINIIQSITEWYNADIHCISTLFDGLNLMYRRYNFAGWFNELGLAWRIVAEIPWCFDQGLKWKDWCRFGTRPKIIWRNLLVNFG